jgi:HPt (histidine-containing phosphotransfer) domain-containing protein
MAKAACVQAEVSEASNIQDIVDWSVLESLTMLQKPGTTDLRSRLISIYLKSSPALMDRIKTALITADAPLLTTSAHTLKSSSLSLGAIRLGTLCAELEKIGRTNALLDAGQQLILIEEQYAAVTALFRNALHHEGESRFHMVQSPQ